MIAVDGKTLRGAGTAARTAGFLPLVNRVSESNDAQKIIGKSYAGTGM